MSETLLGDLRGRFRETSRIRLDEMVALLDALERDPRDAASLQSLARHFHGLAGMGGTYGFPRISTVADEAEGELLPLVRNGSAVEAASIARWRAAVAEMRRELEAGPAGKSRMAWPRPFNVHLSEHDEEIAKALAAEEITCDPSAAADVRVVIGADRFEERLRAIRSGADLVAAKPVDVDALVRRVMALRERREHPARRILAVEDDPTTGALIRGYIGAAGYEVSICRDAADFENTLLTFAPDLVLMDVQLASDVSGHDLLRYVRQSERFATLPVIVVTSDSQRRAILDSAHAGADLLIPKPVDWDVLLSQIGQCLERAAAVRELTERDPLTGVLTRSAFESRARQRAASGSGTVLVLLDLDHFKDVNDTHGHAAGDRVLASTGALLRRSLRQTDVVARYGGEEFALLLEDLTLPAAAALCERLLEELAGAAGVTFSAGVATLEGSFEDACRRADAALYEAKRSGRARVVV